ncbi:ATP-binding protein [Nostoc sp. CHAB 5836]|uniref:ATP-binding protein n=1 Tax=Nostoc sp. CHAB 5836 TaxID=2780404 RepID=UPI001E3731CA|nr:ATP-binding protein [Nostoc sp. CHAB 5836]MCC5618617.1 ATP-binding protein [Nostoc sp. CHAB 5836]
MNIRLIQQVFDLIKLNNPLIAIESPLQERLRLLQTLTRECQEKNVNCYLWTLEDDQLHQLQVNEDGDLALQLVLQYQAMSDDKPLCVYAKNRREHYFEILRFWKTTDLQGIVILSGIFPWLSEPTTDPDFFLTAEWIKSALLNMKLYNRNSNKTAILLGPNAILSSDIAAVVPTVIQQLPTVEEISTHLQALLPEQYSKTQTPEIANACVGMYIADIEYAISWAMASGNTNAQELTLKLSTYKINLLRRVYNIEFLQPPAIEVGGLDLMQLAFKRYKRLLTPLAKAYNLRLPKGILLIGPPGTGKSHSAKVCSQRLGIPMIILEWGSFRSYGNKAEYKLKSLLALVDRINRVILYLDDFDKGFAGDDDLSRRLAGMLLTWMQERTSDVLIIASANNIEWLPPELTRSGRFDDIFKVDLPNNGERHSIFTLHLARFDYRFRDGNGFTDEEWRRLLKATHRCVGAEIQAIVERAAISTFCQMFPDDVPPAGDLPPLDITLKALLEARNNINPLAIREADRIESMRNKADLQGNPSSPVDSSIYSVGNIDIFG